MKEHTDINDTLVNGGEAAARARHDRARRYKGKAYQSDVTTEPAKRSNGKAQEQGLNVGVTVEAFRAYMPTHSYIFEPSGEMWPASSVNSRIPPGFAARTREVRGRAMELP